jgi:hypothetical protein
LICGTTSSFTRRRTASTLTDYTDSPETLPSVDGGVAGDRDVAPVPPDIDGIYGGAGLGASTLGAGVVAYRKAMLAPYIEFRTFDSKLDYYSLELSDLVTVNMPTKAGDTADTTWQVLGVGIDLMTWRTKLTLVRRRTPSSTVLGSLLMTNMRIGRDVLSTATITATSEGTGLGATWYAANVFNPRRDRSWRSNNLTSQSFLITFGGLARDV